MYDRTDLIHVTTRTVLENMLMGIILIFVLQWVFLGDLRSALIVASTIPFALAFAVTIMVIRGESANLLSVGAIDFGLIVDATVIMVENIFRHLSEPKRKAPPSPPIQPCAESKGGLSGKLDLIARAGQQVGRGIFRDHHHRRLRAAVHARRGRRPYLRADGADIALIAGGSDRDLCRLTGVGELPLPEHVSEAEINRAQAAPPYRRPVIELALANRSSRWAAAAWCCC